MYFVVCSDVNCKCAINLLVVSYSSQYICPCIASFCLWYHFLKKGNVYVDLHLSAVLKENKFLKCFSYRRKKCKAKLKTTTKHAYYLKCTMRGGARESGNSSLCTCCVKFYREANFKQLELHAFEVHFQSFRKKQTSKKACHDQGKEINENKGGELFVPILL